MIEEETLHSSVKVPWRIDRSVKRDHIVTMTVAMITDQIEVEIATKVDTRIVVGIYLLTRNFTMVVIRATKITIRKIDVGSVVAMIEGIMISIDGTRIGKKVQEEAADMVVTRIEEVVEIEATNGKTSINGIVKDRHLKVTAIKREMKKGIDQRTCPLILQAIQNLEVVIQNRGALRIMILARVTINVAI